MTHLGKNIGENLQELRLDKDFLDMTPKSTIHKRKKKVNKLDFTKMKIVTL